MSVVFQFPEAALLCAFPCKLFRPFISKETLRFRRSAMHAPDGLCLQNIEKMDYLRFVAHFEGTWRLLSSEEGALG